MHACGHDVHLAAVTAVARTLEQSGCPLPLVRVLQPREETLPSRAKDVVESDPSADHDLRASIGVLVQPRLPQGHFAARPGPVNAAAAQYGIVVNGRPGHAAYPHLTADPVVASADLIGTLQHLISRQVNPTNPTVVTIAPIRGGNSPNIGPAEVRMTGILRAFDEHDRVLLHAAMDAVSQAVCDVHGCVADVDVSLGALVQCANRPVTRSPVHCDVMGEYVSHDQADELDLRCPGPSPRVGPGRTANGGNRANDDERSRCGAGQLTRSRFWGMGSSDAEAAC